MRFVVSVAVMMTAIPASLSVSANDASHHSPYVGQEQRRITGLSDADIEELTRGGGWGLAKAAELNGLPGPAHLLDMRDEIGLSDDQVSVITAIRDAMRREAQALGREMIVLEQALDEGFRQNSFTPATLQAALNRIGKVRSALRYTHLAAHLQTPDILTPQQIAQYNALRGYTKSVDPCAKVPTGHNPVMWRKHNGCE